MAISRVGQPPPSATPAPQVISGLEAETQIAISKDGWEFRNKASDHILSATEVVAELLRGSEVVVAKTGVRALFNSVETLSNLDGLERWMLNHSSDPNIIT